MRLQVQHGERRLNFEKNGEAFAGGGLTGLTYHGLRGDRRCSKTCNWD